MKQLLFRAVILDKKAEINFSLKDLVDPKPLFPIRELLIPWLRAGNIPDMFTGRTDRNGKEIYEGDIVKFKGMRDGFKEEIVAKIIYKNGSLMYLTDREYEVALVETDCEWNPDNCEVIGNNYENSELWVVSS